MYSTVTFEGNLAADVEVKENKAGGVYLDAVVLVNQGKDSDANDRTPDPLADPDHRPHRRERRQPAQRGSAAGHRIGGDRLLDRQADRRGPLRPRVLAQSVGVSLTFARVTGIQRNTRDEA
jgi:hypothetical protein